MGMRAAKNDFNVMKKYVRDLFYGMPLCGNNGCATYGPVDAVLQWGVEFSCPEIGTPAYGFGDAVYGPCGQNRIADYEALWRDWAKRLASYNEFPSGIVADNYYANNDTRRTSLSASAAWAPSTYVPNYWATGYQTATTGAGTEDGFTFSFYLPSAGTRTVDAWWTEGPTRTTGATYVARTGLGTGGSTVGTASANQQVNGGRWNTLGTFNFPAGWNSVTLSRAPGSSGQYAIADAMRLR
jgi:hypothetical protein